eukprot:GILK01004072.1.p1 GENE.GILK01004072.1~~GILK01004072.1.p1  ORF type:complete len:433 (-),score=54.67 GILK01004072.1:331-1503(-)
MQDLHMPIPDRVFRPPTTNTTSPHAFLLPEYAKVLPDIRDMPIAECGHRHYGAATLTKLAGLPTLEVKTAGYHWPPKFSRTPLSDAELHSHLDDVTLPPQWPFRDRKAGGSHQTFNSVTPQKRKLDISVPPSPGISDAGGDLEDSNAYVSAKKRPWSKEEDETLMRLVQQNGPRKWSQIAAFLPGRVGKQCRERWHNHLCPSVNKSNWTAEEDALIFEYQRQYGNQWAEIARHLTGRTDNAIKNRYYSQLRRQQRTSTKKVRSEVVGDTSDDEEVEDGEEEDEDEGSDTEESKGLKQIPFGQNISPLTGDPATALAQLSAGLMPSFDGQFPDIGWSAAVPHMWASTPLLNLQQGLGAQRGVPPAGSAALNHQELLLKLREFLYNKQASSS